MTPGTEATHDGQSAWSLDELLKKMPELKASDLIITAGACPQYKVLGSLQPLGDTKLTPADTEQLARNLMTETQYEKFLADRSIDMSTGIPGVARFRANVFFQRGSIAMAIRMIPFSIPEFQELGLPSIVERFAMRPHGLVLITGPAGTGKSTTMAAMINFINKRKSVHIVCMEDPIEYAHQHGRSIIHQREILSDAHTFSEALRSVFRQAPDVIMVGEMRDIETIRLALQLAETGHLILATFHTHDTTQAITRMVSVFPPHEQEQVYTVLSMVLLGVISQCLIPTADNTRRVLACEVLNVNNAVRNLIREHQTQQIYSVLQTGKAEDMMTMNDSLKDLCDKGLVTDEMAMRRSPRPKELARMLGLDPAAILTDMTH